MGGPGSGKTKLRNRRLVEDCEVLDVNQILKYGFEFYPTVSFIDSISNPEYLSIRFLYNSDGELIPSKEKIPLTSTTQYLGKRYYFKCPQCNNRFRKLYKHPDTMNFKCRVCHNLIYQSQKSNVYDGWIRKVSKENGMTPKNFKKAFSIN